MIDPVLGLKAIEQLQIEFPSYSDVQEFLQPLLNSDTLAKAERTDAEKLVASLTMPTAIPHDIWLNIVQKAQDCHVVLDAMQKLDVAKQRLAVQAAVNWAKDIPTLQSAPLQEKVVAFVEACPMETLHIGTTSQSKVVSVKESDSIDVAILNRAFSLVQQQVIISLLTKWAEAEKKLSSHLAKLQKQDVLTHEAVFHAILQAYLSESIKQKRAIEQPALAIIFSAICQRNTTIDLFPKSIAASLPPELNVELNILASAILSTATTWALPVVTALSRSTSSDMQKQVDSAKAFAITLSSIVFQPSTDALISNCIAKTASGSTILMPPIVLCKVKLAILLEGLAQCYFAQYGAVSSNELMAIIQGDMKGIGKEDVIAVVAKDIRTLLNELPESEKLNFIKELCEQYDVEPADAELLKPIIGFMDSIAPAPQLHSLG